MKHTTRILTGVALGVCGLLAGCAPEAYYNSPPPPPPQPALTAAPVTGACNSCGAITSVQALAPNDYQVTIRLDNGSVETIHQAAQPAFQVGDRVQVLTQTYPQ